MKSHIVVYIYIEYIITICLNKLMSKSIGKYVYDEKNLIGSGAFGKVFRGFDTENKIDVAIKGN